MIGWLSAILFLWALGTEPQGVSAAPVSQNDCGVVMTPDNVLGSMKFNTNNTTTYEFTLTNQGDVADAVSINVSQILLDDHVELDVALEDAFGNPLQQPVLLDPGESVQVVLRLTVPPSAKPKTWNHVHLEISSTQCGPISTAVIRTYLYQGNHEPTAYDLEVTKFAEPSPGIVGEPLRFTILVKNTGEHIDGEDLVLTDWLPDAFQYVSSDPPATVSGQQLQWQRAALVAGAEWYVYVDVVPTCAAVGSGEPNRVSVVSGLPEEDITNNHYELIVDVVDMEPPVFSLPAMVEALCVEDLWSAIYNDGGAYPVNDFTEPRPDYYFFVEGGEMFDISNIADNCPLPAATGEVIAWTLDIGSDGLVNYNGVGQVSTHIFPGGGLEMPVGSHRFTFTVSDAHGNQTVTIFDFTVKPRPSIQLP